MRCGQGKGPRSGCKRNRRVIRFLRPCLLVLLHHGDGHGYSLLGDLAAFGFDQLDPSLVYRVLREMESEGLIRSTWDEDSLGPQRRVYRITLEGEEHLNGWIEDLSRTRMEIDKLLATYHRAKDQNNYKIPINLEREL